MTEKIEIIYVGLLDEGIQVWKPVQAYQMAEMIFRISRDNQYDRSSEKWEFEPGSLVKCGWRKTAEGTILVAESLVES